ncbi:MAG: hypothetical protein J6C15_01685 [Bacteroidaceae bacterium]|nr:hypothetical protein [Bacteroidaceae bacterium]
MTIAVDFDGTIVEQRYPAIGKEIPFATATLRHLIDDGHKLVLWTVREGKLLEEALEWCEKRGVKFYTVNREHEDDNVGKNKYFSRKVKADVFIDDRNVGGLPDWGVIYELISRNISYETYLNEHSENFKPKKKWWQF